MTHASLFSGIGGFDLAADWAGWENIFHCEINPFCQKVLNYYWPKAISHDNIKTTDFSVYRGTIDVLTGGFPCQPYSSAGKRLGKEDERHLWPEMRRAIREIQPRWIVGENVFGIVNWSHGLVFDEVQSDLEAEGYEVQTFILPACAVGAPHRRDRVWFVAHTDGFGNDRGKRSENGNNEGEQPKNTKQSGDRRGSEIERFGKESTVTNPARPTNSEQSTKDKFRPNRLFIDFSSIAPVTNYSNTRLQRSEQPGAFDKRINGEHAPRSTAEFCKNNDWQQFPTQPPVCGGDDGIPAGLAGITIPKHRQESLKAYGNAIVPQVAYRIFDSINQYENIVSK